MCVCAVRVCMLVLCDNAIGRGRRTPTSTSTSALTAGVQKSKIVTNSIYCIYSALSVHKCRNSARRGCRGSEEKRGGSKGGSCRSWWARYALRRVRVCAAAAACKMFLLTRRHSLLGPEKRVEGGKEERYRQRDRHSVRHRGTASSSK